MKNRLVIVSGLLLMLLLAACGSAETTTGITVSDVWGRPSPRVATNGAFYMNIHNGSKEADRLIGAASNACDAIELHESIMEDGVMSMVHVEEIPLPAGATVELKVGGLHVMCLDKQADFAVGSRIPLTLFFANAEEMAVEAEIKEQ